CAAAAACVSSRGCAAWRAFVRACAAACGAVVRGPSVAPLAVGPDVRATGRPAGGVRRTCGQPAAMWTTAPGGRQADAAAAGALLVVEDDEEDEVDDDPESDF